MAELENKLALLAVENERLNKKLEEKDTELSAKISKLKNATLLATKPDIKVKMKIIIQNVFISINKHKDKILREKNSTIKAFKKVL